MRKIGDAITLGRENRYENARIVFNAEDGTSHTAILDTETGDLLSDGYIKRFRLQNFDPVLPEASVVISPQVKDRINGLFGK